MEEFYKEELIRLIMIIFLMIACIVIGMIIYLNLVNPNDPVVTESLKNACDIQTVGNCITK